MFKNYRKLKKQIKTLKKDDLIVINKPGEIGNGINQMVSFIKYSWLRNCIYVAKWTPFIKVSLSKYNFKNPISITVLRKDALIIINQPNKKAPGINDYVIFKKYVWINNSLVVDHLTREVWVKLDNDPIKAIKSIKVIHNNGENFITPDNIIH